MSRVRIPPSLPTYDLMSARRLLDYHGRIWGYQGYKCRCLKCKAAWAKYQWRRRDNIRAEGLCGRCFKWPAKKGIRHCQECITYYREWRRARDKARRDAKKAVVLSLDQGLQG